MGSNPEASLTPREKLFYPGELDAAANVIERFADRLEAGHDVIDGDVITDKLRGLARAIRAQAQWIAGLRSNALVGLEDPLRKLPK